MAARVAVRRCRGFGGTLRGCVRQARSLGALGDSTPRSKPRRWRP